MGSSKPRLTEATSTMIYRVDTWHALYSIPGFEKAPVDKGSITKGRLVGDYEMPPSEGMRPCGILGCETDHRHGFIVEMLDRRLSHVGRDCGKGYFGASWMKVRKALNAAKKESAAKEAANKLKASVMAVIARWPSFDSTDYEEARTILLHFDRLPDLLRSTLENRARQGDSSIPSWRDATEQEIKQAKFYGRNIRRVQIELGPLVGLRGIHPRTRIDFLIDQQRPSLIRDAEALIEDAGVKSDALDSMMRKLSAFPEGARSSLKQLQAFIQDSNLKAVANLLAAKDLGIKAISYDPSGVSGFVIKS